MSPDSSRSGRRAFGHANRGPERARELAYVVGVQTVEVAVGESPSPLGVGETEANRAHR